MKKILTLFSIAVFLSILILPRFYHLGSQPPGLHIDEVSFAAEAIAIAQTGRDTWNVRYPLIFKAFGEWKAPGLVYSMAFWAKALGRMDNTVARLPSAIAGLVILASLYATLNLLYRPSSKLIGFLSIFILAFSPWHFDMSRIFYEAFSALAFLSIFLYFLTKATLAKTPNLKLWALAAIFAAFAGYYYASIRYVVMLVLLLAVFVQDWNWKFKLKSSFAVITLLLVVGLGWVGDLVSEKGLNRLYYYQAKSKEGATLEIDEKRGYCYLSVNRNPIFSKPCYYLWNKPLLKFINAGKTYYTYLGSDSLFVKSTSEFGFDSEYGAYLLPILPIYLVGLFIVLRGVFNYLSSLFHKNSKLSPVDRLYTIYVGTALISLLPAAVANNINMRMGLIALYIVAIIISIGLKNTIDWLKLQFGRLTLPLLGSYFLILGFFIIQSLSHYFLVFTHSNDLMWTSDAQSVFSYVKSVSGNYDRIVDAELHGPLAPYFYGDITTSQIQSGTHSESDTFGFTYLTKAGKYELRHVNVKDLACEKISQHDERKTLVITSPVADLAELAKFKGKSWSGALLLHEVYDVDDIINHEIKANPSFVKNCSSK